ncbi:hypothetical protein ACJZ2D_004810 [Fusarium nematophilum]
MKFASVLPLAAVASAKLPPLVEHFVDPSGLLKIELSRKEGTIFEAEVNNSRDWDIKVLKNGSFLDDGTLERATVLFQGERLPFMGKLNAYNGSDFLEQDFAKIPARKSIKTEFDLGQTHNFSAQGWYTITMRGFLAFSEELSPKVVGFVPYEANELEVEMEGQT